MTEIHRLQTIDAAGVMTQAHRRGDGNAFAVLSALLLATGLFAAVLIANFALTGHAEARVNSGDGGDRATMCRAYQSDYDNAMAELSLARASGNYQKAYELRNKIQLIRNLWDDECSGDFGSIAYRVAPNALTDATATPQNDLVVDGSQGSAKDTGASLTHQGRSAAP